MMPKFIVLSPLIKNRTQREYNAFNVEIKSIRLFIYRT